MPKMAISTGLFFSLSLCLLFWETSCQNNPVVELPFGKIRGSFANGYYQFNNIPFAKPPVGKLRFEPPVPYTEKWNEEIDGTQPMIKCANFEKFAQPVGTEDCLYLHVSTPDTKCDKLYPVRVQIHRGAYVGGSPDSMDTSILVKHGIVIVTMGYRLGPLGFFSTGDKVISGNNGLKDQRLATMWVKENIKSFCGDPNNILLGGVSAGGTAAHLHLLSKSTEKYVNAIESHNAVTTCPFGLQVRPQDISKRFADLIHCPNDDSKSIKACLQDKSIDELRAATFSLLYYGNNPFITFAPVVESPDSEDPFITKHPEDIMRNGEAANLTWFIGYTEREGSYNSAAFLTLNENGVAEIEILNERWEELAPIMLFYSETKNEDERRQYSSYLKEKYMQGKKFSEENYRLLENLYTDILYTDHIKNAILLHRKFCPGKLYVSYYKYPHNYGLGNLISFRNDVSFGADHSADTIFTIPRPNLKHTVFSDRDRKFSDKLIGMYVNWANTGVLKFGNVDVPLNTPTDDSFLTLNENCYSVDGCTEVSEAGCNCYPYVD